MPYGSNDELASVLLERILAELAAGPLPARRLRGKAEPGAGQLELLR